jgi:hypothetical protein
MEEVFWLKANAKKGFYFLAGINRPITPNQVTKLAASILMMGIIRPIVIAELSFITGVKQKYIVDGQHLYNACLRLGIDIPYIIVTVKNQEELIEKIALLNASSKSWTQFDYITSWSSIKDDYKKLNRYFEIYDFELGILAAVLADKTLNVGGGNSVTSKIIKTGAFKVYDEPGAKKKLDYLTDVLKIIPRMNRIDNKYACSEYLSFLSKVGSKYDHSKFLAKLLKIKDSFVFATQEPGALETTFKQLL